MADDAYAAAAAADKSARLADHAAAAVAEEERPTKRAKRDDDEANQPPPPQTNESSIMVRLLGRDVHAVHSILRMLDLREVAFLARTCRTWRSWIEHPPAHLQQQRWQSSQDRAQLATMPDQIVDRAHSTILREYLTTLEIRGIEQDEIEGAAAKRKMTSAMLHALPRFGRLASIQLYLWHEYVDRDHLREYLEVRVVGADKISLASSVFSSIGVLQRLQTFVLILKGELDDDEEDQAKLLDWSNLARLPLLKTFRFALTFYFKCSLKTFRFDCSFLFECSLDQAQVLGQCKSLTDLDCGSWYQVDDAEDGLAKQIDEGPLDTLVRGQLATMRKLGLSTPPLTNLHLESTKMSSTVLDKLLQLSNLTSLFPVGWSDDITPAHLARLPEWKQLKEIGIGDLDGVTTDDFLQPLLQCKQLTCLYLDDMGSISSAQLHDLCTKLPELIQLIFWRMQLESLQPFEASNLQVLKMHRCSDPDDGPLHAFVNLPSMRALTYLALLGGAAEPDGREAAERQVAALLARMPRLQANKFEHDYLSDDDDQEDDQEDDLDDEDEEATRRRRSRLSLTRHTT